MKEDGQMGLDKVQITRGVVSGGRAAEDTRGKKAGREKRGRCRDGPVRDKETEEGRRKGGEATKPDKQNV